MADRPLGIGDQVAAVRELHEPEWIPWLSPTHGETNWACGECIYVDCDEAIPSEWPCPTAEIVYSKAEIAEQRAQSEPLGMDVQ